MRKKLIFEGLTWSFILWAVAFFLTAGGWMALCPGASAQEAGSAVPEARTGYKPRTTSSPVCFTITSDIDYTIFGQVMSDYFRHESGRWARHRHNFRIKKGEEYPVCTTGPFFNESEMLIRVKSLIPIFSCYFDLGKGDRTLRFYFKDTSISPEEEMQRVWADCRVVYPDLE